MYWFVYLKKKPRYFIKRIPKNTRGVECTDCELKAETKARKILHVVYRWVNVQKLSSSGICLMYMRPGLTGKTWKTTIDKLILVIANKDREACVNGSNTHKDVVSGDTTITTFWSTFDARNENRSLVAKLPLKKTSGLFRIPHPGLSTFYFSYRLHVFQIMVSSFQ